ncbi:MAG: response regulator, partial [Clostridium sp.]|nr:response regulator [Clostridium sp.]
ILTYTVQDTGIGMTREFMSDMYRNFTRAVDTRIDKVQGSGLGLAITKQLTDLMGGTIDCESEIGKGTKFTVTLTLPIAETTTDDLVLPPLKLLLVDDDEVFLETAEDTLVSMGVTVDKADNGRTAVEMAAARHEAGQGYRVVLVDFKMPDMGGIETAAAIRAKVGDEALIIIISAYDWTEIEDAAKAAGVHAFINKPMFKSVIYDKMNEFLHFSKVETASADEDAGGLQGLRLLVAEDNDLNWEIIEEMLKYYDISTVRAENGQICVELLCDAEADTYDAVLMDIQMPVMNGRDASRAIRALPDKVKRNIPIIAMTADAFAEDIQACLEAGMNGHAAKPIDMKKLFGELKDAGLANKRRGEVG